MERKNIEKISRGRDRGVETEGEMEASVESGRSAPGQAGPGPAVVGPLLKVVSGLFKPWTLAHVAVLSLLGLQRLAPLNKMRREERRCPDPRRNVFHMCFSFSPVSALLLSAPHLLPVTPPPAPPPLPPTLLSPPIPPPCCHTHSHSFQPPSLPL